MFTLQFGIYALGALAAVQRGLAAPVAEDGSVQYMPSKRDVVVSAPLFAAGGPKFTDIHKVFNYANQWFNAPLAACAVTEEYRGYIKDRFSIKDDGVAVAQTDVVFLWTPNGPKEPIVKHSETPVNSTTDPWWTNAIKYAATNLKDMGIQGLNGDGTMSEGNPEDAYRLITNREAQRIADPSKDVLNKFVSRANKVPVIIGMGESTDNITTWSAITKGPDAVSWEQASISYYDFESGTEKTMSGADAEQNVRALVLDKANAQQ
ncbi:hypothetical protein IAU59_002587 [Kwoniella sp. CBS 9459]